MRLALSHLPISNRSFFYPLHVTPSRSFAVALERQPRVRHTERVYFITTRFYRGDPAGSSLFALPCL